jgi:hypothetical protein
METPMQDDPVLPNAQAASLQPYQIRSRLWFGVSIVFLFASCGGAAVGLGMLFLFISLLCALVGIGVGRGIGLFASRPAVAETTESADSAESDIDRG